MYRCDIGLHGIQIFVPQVWRKTFDAHRIEPALSDSQQLERAHVVRELRKTDFDFVQTMPHGAWKMRVLEQVIDHVFTTYMHRHVSPIHLIRVQ